ncbi:MAG: collagen-like protein [Bacteroidales bacterium]|nr:collagen-like protein [Bacteroidales bacterium]
MKKLSRILLALIAVTLMVACGKEGPMGPQGPMGPMGPQGPAGQDGQDGYVNVVSSTLTVYPEDWYWDNTSWRVDFDYDAVNYDVYNSGVVLVYMEMGETWRQIPMTFYYTYEENGNVYYYSSSLETSFYQGGVSVFWTESDFYDGYRPEEHRFRLVAIEAGYYSSHPELDYSNYEVVKEALQLAD